MATNIVLILLVFLLRENVSRVAATNLPVVQLLERDIESVAEWIRIPSAAGEWIWTHRHSIEAMLKQRHNALQPSDVEFVLYTRRDSNGTGHRLELGRAESHSEGSHFRSDRPTRIIVHGWLNTKSSPMVESIRDTYLLLWDYNVIVVDWSACAMQWNYVRVVGCVPIVGRTLGQMLDELQQHQGLTLENAYVIGHSLGAHIAGIAGKLVADGQLHTIIALDPALPLFSILQQENRISHQDATYVEVIHTNGGWLGFLHPIGTADFYANGGSHQPGCGLNVAGMCSHTRAWELFVESLFEPEEKLLATKVDSLDDVKHPALLTGIRDGYVERVKMGGEPSSAGLAQGLYSIRTRDKSPFFD